MKIKRSYILDVLTQSELPRRLAGAMGDYPAGRDGSAAILTALAGVESNYQVDALTPDDGGEGYDSYGLWQLNERWWGTRPQNWETIGTQLIELGDPFDDLVVQPVGLATRTIRRLNAAEQGTIAQISWQYGRPAVVEWVQALAAGDSGGISPAMFVRFRQQANKPVEPGWRERAERFEREYQWALSAVTDEPSPKTKGPVGTAISYWDDLAQEKTPGNLAGWAVLAAILGLAYLIVRR